MQRHGKVSDADLFSVLCWFKRKRGRIKQRISDLRRCFGCDHAKRRFTAPSCLRRIAQHAHIGAMVKVEVRKHHRIDRIQLADTAQTREYTAAAIQQDTRLSRFHDIAGTRRSRARKRAVNAKRSQSHINAPSLLRFRDACGSSPACSTAAPRRAHRPRVPVQY